jgi:glutamate/tyrosine decarboxylase-like PLP-dependent enzyme
MTKQEMKDQGYQVIDAIVEHRTKMTDKKVYATNSYEVLNDIVKREMPLIGEDPSEVFKELDHLISNNVAHLDHPRFFSFIPGPSNYYSVLADTLATGYNVFAGHWMGGAYAAMIETRTLEWLAEIMEFPKESGGIFTSGGSMANLTAIVAARENKLPEDHSNGVIYYSEQTHSSLSKALRVIGFKPKNMRKIKSDTHFRIDTNQLLQTLEEDIKNGLKPFCIIGNAGTTNTGAIDDLNTMAQIAKEKNCWFHIDAAYGGATMLSKEYKKELQGIEKADSITLDPHKWWFQPYEIGCLLVRDRNILKEAFTVTAEYLDDTVSNSGEINYYEHGVQLSRSFRALKLYTFFRCVGLEKIGADITNGIKNAEYIEKLLKQKEYWEIITKPSIGIISFRVKISEDETENDKINAKVSKYLLEDGYAMITTTKLKGHLALRMCPIHPETTLEFLEKTFGIMNSYIENFTEN